MYKIYRNQIPSSLIDSTLKAHEALKSSPYAYFRAQGTTKFEKPILNKH